MEKSGMSRRELLKKAALLTSSIVLPVFAGTGCDTSDKPIIPFLPQSQPSGTDTATSTDATTANTKVDVLIKNASIIDVRTGRVLDENAILIKEGRILDVVAGSDSGISADMTFDLKGAYIVPGLINAHTHMSMPCSLSFLDQNVLPSLVSLLYRQSRKNALECVKHGVTTVRDVGAMYNICENLKRDIAAGDILGPRIINACVVDITGSFMSMAFGLLADPDLFYFKAANTKRQAVSAVRGIKKAGREWIKLYHQVKGMATPLPPFLIMNDDLAKSVCDEARSQGIPVAQHVSDSTGFAKGLYAGVTTFEHMLIDRELTGDEIRQVIDKNISFIPTTTVGYGLCYQTKNDPDWSAGLKNWILRERARLLPAMIDEYLLPEMAAAQETTFENYSDPDYFRSFHLGEPIVLNPDAFIGALTTGVANMMAIYQAGVKIGCGNDGGMPFIFPGAMGLEMHLLKRNGYAPDDVLKMATINNAEILGLDRDLGSIEKGKIADLAVFTGNPLLSFENAFTADMVFKNGKMVHSA